MQENKPQTIPAQATLLKGSDVAKWALGLFGTFLVAILLGGSTLILKLDKTIAIQERELTHTRDAFNDFSSELKTISRELRSVTTQNSQRLTGVEAQIEDLDDTVKLIGRNLEDKIERRVP